MKIAFFGNTNNSPLMLSQAMQNMGHEVLLIVNKKELLHRPESRYPEYSEKYPEWIVDGSQFSEWDYISLNPHIAPILNTLWAYDALILNDLGPSLLPLFQKPAISLLTGSDVYYYANYQSVDVRSSQWGEGYKQSAEGKFSNRLLVDFIQRQRDGIGLSVAVHYMPSGIELLGDALLSEIGIQNSRRFFQFVADLDRITPSPQPNNMRIQVFCPVRVTWKLPIEPGRSMLDYKGSDIMIRGLGLFYRKTGTKLDIHLVRKGLHIDDLEQLIVEVGIDDQITWLDEMSLTAVWEEMAQSDIVLEQFGNSMVARVGMDAMASGRPVIGNVRPELLGDGIPICQARTPEELCKQLERLVFDPQERERIGKAGRDYIEKHANIDEFAQKCLDYLNVFSWNQNEIKTSPHPALSYYLQQRHSLFEEKAEQECIIQRNLEREFELLDYLKSYALSGGEKLKRAGIKGPYHHESGRCWAVAIKDFHSFGDDEDHPAHSTLLLYEDDKLLQPSHAVHDDIRNLGGGGYSHWNETLYFSTSDGSDPNTNGREYRIIYID